MAMVEMKNLGKIYDNQVQAVKNINIKIDNGEFIVIVGPSGCGKSTLLRMIAGLEGISEGELIFDDKIVNELEPRERRISMVFQNYALYPHMTNRKNIGYSLKLMRMSKEEIKRRVEEVAEHLQLTPYLDRKPNQISGGQRQRVAMARAIVREPSVFLFDEPLSNLDAKLRVQMRLQIKKLQRQLNITSLYVTHDQTEAMTLADRLIVLNNGEVQQIGSPMSLYLKPSNKFVAGFIGSPAMNFLPLDIDGQQMHLGANITLDKPAALNCQGTVTLGIRPEDIEHTTNSADLPYVIHMVEQLGSDSLLHGHLQAMPEHALSVLVKAGEWHEEQQIFIRFSEEKLHFFDNESAQRLE